MLKDIGDLVCERGEYELARPFYEESMVIFSELGDVRGIANYSKRLLEWLAREDGSSEPCA